MIKCHDITTDKIIRGHEAFVTRETLYLFYDFARTLVKKGWHHNSVHDLALGISAILQTWNRGFYQLRPFRADDFQDIENLLSRNLASLTEFKDRHIRSLNDGDAQDIERLFRQFELLLGQVGAAKSLHLLAPNFFPLWDRKIAAAYRVGLKPRNANSNGVRYFKFMKCQQRQSQAIGNNIPPGITVLKAIDEYNYSCFTKGWICPRVNRRLRPRGRQ